MSVVEGWSVSDRGGWSFSADEMRKALAPTYTSTSTLTIYLSSLLLLKISIGK